MTEMNAHWLSIPIELVILAQLHDFKVNSNSLTGAPPNQLGSLASLTSLGLSSNKVGRPIPSELAEMFDNWAQSIQKFFDWLHSNHHS